MTASEPGGSDVRPIRVLYYIGGNVFGGAHNQCLQLARPLLERGYETVVLLPDEPGNAAARLQGAGIEVHQRELTRMRAVRSPGQLLRRAAGVARQGTVLAGFLAEHRIGMVQLHGLLAVDGASAARRAGVPLVWQLIDTRPPPVLRRLLTPVVNSRADAVMTTGTRLLQEYPRLDADPARFVPFFPPVDGQRFPVDVAAGTREQVRRRLLGPDGDPTAQIVGSLGNLNPQKGFEHLITAVASLRRDRGDVSLVVRGEASPGHPEYAESLRRLLDQHGFPAGTVAPLPDNLSAAEFMAALDVFALTPVRRSEGVPTVLLEAMWAGLPCVVTDVGGVRDALTDETGAVCEPESPESIAEVLGRVLDADASSRATMSRRARQLAEDRFTLEVCADAHARAYAMARKNHAARSG